jgi:cation transport regulator ChaB
VYRKEHKGRLAKNAKSDKHSATFAKDFATFAVKKMYRKEHKGRLAKNGY